MAAIPMKGRIEALERLMPLADLFTAVVPGHGRRNQHRDWYRGRFGASRGSVWWILHPGYGFYGNYDR
jgi:hypothetical protein